MNLGKIFKLSILSLMLLFAAGCAAPSDTQTDPGVEDISPGQKSVISAPANQNRQQSEIGERNI